MRNRSDARTVTGTGHGFVRPAGATCSSNARNAMAAGTFLASGATAKQLSRFPVIAKNPKNIEAHGVAPSQCTSDATDRD